MRNPTVSNSWLTTICSLLLATGLFCVQVCQVICATVACAGEAVATQPPTTSEHAHCHPQPQPEPQTPRPHNHSHDCQHHAVLQSLLPGNQAAKQQPQAAGQPVFIVSFCWAENSQPFAALNKPAPAPFKPPPREQHSTVQRI
ncbi:MAG: hypothetical protein HYR56_05385 [Acidobacteria bacterium]|nr:hypothetical protein [Acidobacteriota bacterium]MBI3427139.1 hypothetical protein [Acidobacteriota bacterium]